MAGKRTRRNTLGAEARRATSDDFRAKSRPASVSGRANGESPPGHDPDHYSEEVEARVAEMRALLTRVAPSSSAEALRALRAAFPETSLSTRVAAISHRPD